MASIQKRRAGAWRVMWRDLGGKQRSRTCPTRRLAKRLVADIEECLALGRDWSPDNPSDAVLTLDQVLDAYLEHRALRLRPSTMRRYRENVKLFQRFLGVRFGGHLVTPDQLSRPLLEGFYTWLLQAENGLHARQRLPDTARKITEVAQLAWAWADDSERWPDDIPRPRAIEMVRVQPKVVVAPSWDEMDRCVHACDGWIRKLAVILRYTGLRVGETMQLLWSDVDLETARLTIRPEIDKSKRGRVIPFSPHLIEELAGFGVRQGYVVPETSRGGARERQAVSKYMADRWRKTGVRVEAYRGDPHHAYRKGFKSGMLALGAHTDAVDYLQGHKLGGGARGRYIDPWMALRLDDVVKTIPKIGGQNVVALAAADQQANR